MYNIKGVEKGAQKSLFWGITISSILIIIGIILMIISKDFSFSPSNLYLILTYAMHGKGSAILSLGILVLMVTPIITLIVVFFEFIVKKEFIYTLVSIALLIIIGIGVYIGVFK
ncbi:MAG: hypothetical protein DRG20_04715 [Deltaproteobacteria bacterium]|nr:MAG: hypothetical protein DRG20_04715 [Deltaproteobacteria bacterium]